MNKLASALKQGGFIVTSELPPPKGTDLSGLFAKADMLRSRVTAFNLTESHGARMAMDPVAAAHLLMDRGLEPVVQMTCRDKNRIAIQASLLGASALGVPNVVFMGGDPPANGDHPDAKPVFDLFASQLIEAAHALNLGTDLMGNALNAPTRLCIGAVANPGAENMQAEIDNARRKADAGAEFFQTQAVYDTSRFADFVHSANLDVPVLAGIIPINSVKMARYMNARIPGVNIPEHLIARIDGAGDHAERVDRISIDIAAGIIQELKNECRGVHVMAIGREEKIPEILAAAGV